MRPCQALCLGVTPCGPGEGQRPPPPTRLEPLGQKAWRLGLSLAGSALHSQPCSGRSYWPRGRLLSRNALKLQQLVAWAPQRSLPFIPLHLTFGEGSLPEYKLRKSPLPSARPWDSSAWAQSDGGELGHDLVGSLPLPGPWLWQPWSGKRGQLGVA